VTEGGGARDNSRAAGRVARLLAGQRRRGYWPVDDVEEPSAPPIAPPGVTPAESESADAAEAEADPDRTHPPAG